MNYNLLGAVKLGAEFWVLIALLVLLVIFMFFRFRQQKKMQSEQVNMLDNLKVGDKVTTHIGVYGRIIKIEETTKGKVFTIETGDKNKSELELDYRYIAGIDDKELVTYDANGNVIEPNKPSEIFENKNEIDSNDLGGIEKVEIENLEDMKLEEKPKKKKNKKDDEIK